MRIEIQCSMCGAGKTVPVNTDGTAGKIDAAKIIEASGWITQVNGQNFDIYCSKECAA